MKTKIIEEQIEYVKKIKNFKVEFTVIDGEGDNIGTKNITLEFSRMVEEDTRDNQYNNEYEFSEASLEIFKELAEDVQEDIIEYVYNLVI